MSEPTHSPFDLLIEQFRLVVRQEIAAALDGNGHVKPMTAEQLAKALQVETTTIYQWVKAGEIPYLKVGRFLRFNLQAVLDSLGKNKDGVDSMQKV